MVDCGGGWYDATYSVDVAGPFELVLGLNGIFNSGSYKGTCQPAVSAVSYCTFTGDQKSIVAGQQGKLYISRADR